MGRTLEELYQNESWFPEIRRCLEARYYAIEERLVQTFRYVQLHPDNGSTFSYEFASILRDCGSVFTSVLDKAIRETKHYSKDKRLNIRDFKKFLNSADQDFYRYTIIPNPLYPLVLLPYCAFSKLSSRSGWWDSYNNIKHSEIENYTDGNLKNVMNAVGALAILCNCMGIFFETNFIGSVARKYPPDAIEVQPDRIPFPDC
jgi:hypothetical protein